MQRLRVSSQGRDISPAEKGRPEPRCSLAEAEGQAEHRLRESGLFSLFCFLLALTTCMSEKREYECNFLLGATSNSLPGLWDTPMGW